MTSCESQVPDRYGLQVFWKRRRGREKLMAEIRRAGIVQSESVLEAIERVERRHFVRPDDTNMAYDNLPLAIGRGQTISQPLVVALMSEALAIGSGDRVLEIGTGSGYQAAVLVEMGAKVFSVEIIPQLAEPGRRATCGTPDITTSSCAPPTAHSVGKGTRPTTRSSSRRRPAGFPVP